MKSIDEIVKSFEIDGCKVNPYVVQKVLEVCYRKMDISGIQDKESYLPLLFKDELRNWHYRSYINAQLILMQIQRGGESCV